MSVIGIFKNINTRHWNIENKIARHLNIKKYKCKALENFK